MEGAFVAAVPLALRSHTMHGASSQGRPRSLSQSNGVMMMAEKSASVPFLNRSRHLDPTAPGYSDFDPLDLASMVPIQFMQEAEIKHGRVAMLAAIGIIFQEFVHLPNEMYANPVATEALKQVPTTGLWHILLFIGALEVWMYREKIFLPKMFDDGRLPGEFNFNPLKSLFKKTDFELRTNEIKNGRLAMIGVGGMIHSMLVFKTPIVAQLISWF